MAKPLDLLNSFLDVYGFDVARDKVESVEIDSQELRVTRITEVGKNQVVRQTMTIQNWRQEAAE